MPSMTDPMQDFARHLQNTMAKHIQDTMKLQVDMLRAVQDPVGDKVQSIGSSMQNIFLEQMKLLSTGMTSPLSIQVEDFSASVQRIMSEQMQMFATSTANPSPEQLDQFFATMRKTIADQMKLAFDLQTTMSQQMQQLMSNLQVEMTRLVGSSEQGGSPKES